MGIGGLGFFVGPDEDDIAYVTRRESQYKEHVESILSRQKGIQAEKIEFKWCCVDSYTEQTQGSEDFANYTDAAEV